MTITRQQEGNELTIAIQGQLDTQTAPLLTAELQESLTGVTDLCIDMEETTYISSAGLRSLLTAQKIMNKQGRMVLRNVNDELMEIFEITGFVDLMTIE